MNIQYTLELLGTGFFAMSGAVAANEKSKPDWFGVTFIGFITSIGGGSIRDMLLGSYPLSWVADANRIYVIIGAIIISSMLYGYLKKMRKLFFLFDSLGIAMFTILGTEKALQFGVNPIIAAIMGMFSAIMGGVLRDVLTNEIPVIFRKEIYASACLAGAVTYLLLNKVHCNRGLCLLPSVLVILVIRIAAVKFNLSLPKYKQLQ